LSYNPAGANKPVAEFVQAQWKQNLGLTVSLKSIEWKTFLDSRAKLEYKGFARTGWVADYMDPYTYLNLFTRRRAITARVGMTRNMYRCWTMPTARPIRKSVTS
jgi:oligopeptide transport system substrate-binding protein